MGIFSDSKQDFKFHDDQEIKKCNKLIGLSQLLSANVPRKALLTVYKSFIRLHLDYGDVLYEKPENENFKNKLIQSVLCYNCCNTRNTKAKTLRQSRSAFTK